MAYWHIGLANYLITRAEPSTNGPLSQLTRKYGGIVFMMLFIFISIYVMPILAIIFCLNLVEIIKKVKKDQSFSNNTFWLTASFVLIVWSISMTAAGGL